MHSDLFPVLNHMNCLKVAVCNSRLHNNGRMLDIYWRLHGEEDIFFVPYDLEVSNQELCYIHKKCEQWRGEEGERRKVSVYDYCWEEEPVSGFLIIFILNHVNLHVQYMQFSQIACIIIMP